MALASQIVARRRLRPARIRREVHGGDVLDVATARSSCDARMTAAGSLYARVIGRSAGGRDFPNASRGLAIDRILILRLSLSIMRTASRPLPLPRAPGDHNVPETSCGHFPDPRGVLAGCDGASGRCP